MKAFSIKNLSVAAVITLFIFSCTGDGEDPQINQMDFDLLTGKWSILQEQENYFEQDGSPLETVSTDYDVNMFTVDFLTATQARIIHVEDGMWAEADYALNEADSTLHISFSVGDEDMDIVLKLLELNETNATLHEIGTEDHNGNTVRYENTLTFAKNDNTVATLTEEQLKVKWSMASQAILEMADQNEDGQFDEINETTMEMEMASIPYNRFSIEFLPDGSLRAIDSYLRSAVNEAATWEMLDGSNFVVTEPDEGQTLIHIREFDGSALRALSILYKEDDLGGGQIVRTKMKGQLALTKNDGREPSVSQAQLVGSWNITDFVEYVDGQDVTGQDNPTGATIRFDNDGTGLLVMGQDNVQLTWKCIDGSNFCFTGLLDGTGPETILLNIKDYDDATGTLQVVEGGMDYDEGTNSEFQWESRIELVKNS